MNLTMHFLTKVQPNILQKSTITRNSLSAIGIQSDQDFEKKLISLIFARYPRMHIDIVSYAPFLPGYYQRYKNSALGTIENSDNEVKAFVVLIPPQSSGTRTGFIAQQLFPTLTTVMMDRNLKSGNDFSKVPIIVINANNETYSDSIALSILSLDIMNIDYVDFYGRDAKMTLLNSGIQPNIQTFQGFIQAVNSITNRQTYFNYDRNLNKVSLLMGNLTNQSMTNEPYYYLMKVVPLVILAIKEDVTIDISTLVHWETNYQSAGFINKNMSGFLSWLRKMLDGGNRTMQKIYYGAPGTGKSHKIDELMTLNNIPERNQFRTTFHPEYTYTDFVGQLVPVKKTDPVTNQEEISYDFYRGVFTDAMKKAFEVDDDIYLIIEEMSRGDVSAIFGDIFQLLDRFVDGVNRGKSKYLIRNKRIADEIDSPLIIESIYLPANLHILGTVNTNDQNVFTIDTAFKRRFQWSYVPTNPVLKTSIPAMPTLTQKYLNNPVLTFKRNSQNLDIYWSDLFGILNIYISDKRFLALGEDKQIGQFFINFKTLTDQEIESEVSNKLLNYLWSDVANTHNSVTHPLFNGNEVTNFSSLIKNAFTKQIFSDEFFLAYDLWLNNSL